MRSPQTSLIFFMPVESYDAAKLLANARNVPFAELRNAVADKQGL